MVSKPIYKSELRKDVAKYRSPASLREVSASQEIVMQLISGLIFRHARLGGKEVAGRSQTWWWW